MKLLYFSSFHLLFHKTMDLKVIISLGLLAVLGFLLFPRGVERIMPTVNGEWVAIKDSLDDEPLHGAKLRKDNPVVKTHDLGYIYRIDRAEVLFDGLPKDYDILVSKTKDAPEYKRAISALSTSREDYYRQITFLPEEARWIQVVVNDWYGTQPKILSTKIGARYQRHSPIESIRTRYNRNDTPLLFDGLKSDSAPKWLGGKRTEKEIRKDDKIIKEITYESPGRDGVSVVFDLGSMKRVYGIAVTTGGNENNLKQYKISISTDGASFQPVYTSPELENKTVTDTHIFSNPYQARYMQLSVGPGGWYGKYPEIREVEIYTDDYQPSNYKELIEDHNATQIYYDDCGINGNALAPHLIQGFPFDRGENSDPQTRYCFKPGEEVDASNSIEERSFCYHYDRITFSYSNLEAEALYWVQVTYLQEKGGRRIQSLDVDGFLLHDGIEIPANVARKFIFAIPPDAYTDGKMELHFNRIAGPNAVVSEVMIYRASKGGAIPITYEGSKIGTELTTRSPVVTGSVVIDGTLDEWPDIYPIIPQKYNSDLLNSPCQMYIQWDKDNLFVALKADRSKFANISNSSDFLRAPDALHLFIDADSTRSQGMYKSGTHHFRFFPLQALEKSRGEAPSGVSKPVTVAQIHHYLDTIPRTIENRKEIEAVVKMIPGTLEYVLEARIPKDSVLREFSPRQGGAIGFNYILSNPYLVEREEGNIIKGFEPLFWSAASRDSAPMFWGKLELIGTISGQVAIMDQSLTNKLTSFNAGDPIILSVLDPDRNTDKNSPQSIKIRISGDLTKDSKEVTLYETSQATGTIQPADDSDLFTAKINTQFGTAPNPDPMTLAVQGREMVTMEYVDPYYGPQKTDVKVTYTVTARVGTTGTISILSRSGKEINQFPAGLRLFFKVVDEDLIKLDSKVSSEPSNELTINVTSKKDTEQVTLVDEKNSGIFVGSIETAYSTIGTPNDGILQVVGNETITAVYRDLLQITGNTNVPVEASAIVGVGNDGTIAIGRSETGSIDDFVKVKDFNAGNSLVIVVKDNDMNKDKASVEHIDIKVEGDSVKDSIVLTLTEISTDSDTFIGSLHTAYGLKPDKNDDLMEVKGKETIKATYTDVIQATGATMIEVSDTAVVNVGNDGTISILKANYLWDLDNFNAGDTLYLKVEDMDLNINPEIGDQVDISLVSERTHDSEMVTLQEKDPNSGIFFGLFGTEYSQQSAPDKKLQVQGNEKVTVVYLDKLRSTGEINVPVTDSCTVNIGTTGRVTIYTKTNPYIPIAGFPDEGWKNTFKAGETLIIQLEDLDANASSTTVTVATDNVKSDAVTATLNAVVGRDGIFSGEVRTEYSEKVIPEDGVLQVQGGEKVSISYLDAITNTGQTKVPITVSLVVRKGETGTIEVRRKLQDKEETKEVVPSLESISSFNAGDAFEVLVHDSDLNIDPDAVDYAVATAKGNRIRDELQLVLQETDPNSGTFSGVVQSNYAISADPDDAVLQVNEREIIAITYIDEVDAVGKPSLPISAELVVRSGSAGSLLIVDENFRELLYFNAGRRIYFRLDDLILSSMLRNNARIAVKGNITKDTEEVILEEIPYPDGGKRGQGIYIGSIPTSYATTPAQDGTLQVQGGEEVKAIYNPQYIDPLTGKSIEQITDTISVNKGFTGKLIIASENGLKLTNFNIGDKLYFKLEDTDLGLDGSKRDSTDISVVGDAVTNVRTIKLLETGENTGIFAGFIETCYGKYLVPGPSTSPDSQPPVGAIHELPLQVVGGEQVTAIYYDAIIGSGETSVKVSDSCKANMIGTATYAPEGVLIDGNMTGWPLENALPAGDEGSNLYVQWDKDNLYILAYVIDPSVVVPDPIKFWENADALEIFIDTKPASQTDLYADRKKESNYYALWFCPKGAGSDGSEVFIGQSVPQIVWNYTAIEKAIQIFPGSRYILEARIPFFVFGDFDPYKTPEDDIIGFNYIIRRSSTGPLQWAPGAKGESNLPPSYFGTLILRKQRE